MHRLLAGTAELGGDSPALSKAAAKHLRVLRPEDGEQIELFDGRGRWRVFAYGGGVLRPSGPVMSAAAPPPLTLFACVTKGSRWDWTVEKSTELGATRIVPVVSARTIVRIPEAERESKRELWQRIAEEAARQSDAKWVPEVLAPVDFNASLPLVRATRCFVGALTTPPAKPFISALLAQPGDPPAGCSGDSLFVGPEGDFTPDELAALVEIAEPVSFGPSILRAETAAIYGLSALKLFASGREK